MAKADVCVIPPSTPTAEITLTLTPGELVHLHDVVGAAPGRSHGAPIWRELKVAYDTLQKAGVDLNA